MRVRAPPVDIPTVDAFNVREPAEAEMLENVFRFGDRQVREVMTPRSITF